jgi:hypothetical protein
MAITCKNCNQHFDGKFCNNCGQSANTKRLNFHDIWHKLKNIIFKNLHEGILYSTRKLLTRPGNTIREYLEGKRVKHYDPISLLIAIAAIYGLLYHYFKINPFIDTMSEDSLTGKITRTNINEWISNHFSLLTCLLIPIYSIGSFVVFRKQGYNFAEHLYLNAFAASQRLLFRIATFPLLVIYNGTDRLQFLLDAFILGDIILMIWCYCQFFNTLKIIKSTALTLLSYLVFFILFSSSIIIVFFILNRFV